MPSSEPEGSTPARETNKTLPMPAPREILELVARFEQQFDAYKSGQYNETQVRREFLDPFFKALGWDIDNVRGFAEAYKDVIHEDQIRIAGVVKAPDYCFCIGGTRKYFLEAKKPSVAIKDEPAPAYQLRRYAWSAKLPLSILSDFEEFAVYDGRVKPHKDDSASTARIFYCTFRDYAEKWDWIYDRFSRDAVLKGAFDKFAESTKVKRGTSEVDAAFLETIEGWRKELAQNLALRNTKLSQRELNFAVQRIIDRIIFLRICEDRGIEDYGRLRALVNGDRIYPRLTKLFEQADDRYNSGLFHFKKEPGRHEAPDELTLDLDIDDKLLRDLLRGLYYPDSPYEFSVLSADILGQVYEQFLGKVIRLTDGHRAVVDDKPEVKKAGGVYYTPTYIVDYIVRQTVGKLVEECARSERSAPVPGAATADSATALKTLGAPGASNVAAGGDARTPLTPRAATAVLNRVAKLRILDPACGSGSFLIGAYQFLLDWHLQFYLANDPAKWAKETRGRHPVIVLGRKGGLQLSIAERKRILLANIYGVDIDAQAVEVTKLSLLLKVLEGESGQAQIYFALKDRVLPDLGDNIKCGNSLIGPDFYHDRDELPLVPNMKSGPRRSTALPLTDEDRYRINVFDWQAEFPEIFRRRRGDESQTDSGGKDRADSRRLLQGNDGGFDAVIGNPPYLRIQGLQEYYSNQIDYFCRVYESASKRFDVYMLFLERGYKLLAVKGKLGFICPHKFVNGDFASNLRQFLSREKAIKQLLSFGHNMVFAQASTYTGIVVMCRGESAPLLYAEIPEVSKGDLARVIQSYFGKSYFTEYSHNELGESPWVLTAGREGGLLKKLRKFPDTIESVFAEVLVGVQSGIDDVHILRQHSNTLKSPLQLFSEKEGKMVPIESELARVFAMGEDVHRYAPIKPTHRCIYPYRLETAKTKILPEQELRQDYPLGYAYLKRHQAYLTEIRERQKTNPKFWYSCHRSRDMRVFEQTRIVTPEISKGCNMTIANPGLYHNTKVYSLIVKPSVAESLAFWLGVLNSKVLWWFLQNTGYVLRGGYFTFKTDYLNPFPLPRVDFSNKSDKTAHDRMVKLVEQMLELHRQLAAARTPHEQTALERQIAATDTQIDRLVYDLYGLTEEEIKIVEGTNR